MNRGRFLTSGVRIVTVQRALIYIEGNSESRRNIVKQLLLFGSHRADRFCDRVGVAENQLLVLILERNRDKLIQLFDGMARRPNALFSALNVEKRGRLCS